MNIFGRIGIRYRGMCWANLCGAVMHLYCSARDGRQEPQRTTTVVLMRVYSLSHGPTRFRAPYSPDAIDTRFTSTIAAASRPLEALFLQFTPGPFFIALCARKAARPLLHGGVQPRFGKRFSEGAIRPLLPRRAHFNQQRVNVWTIERHHSFHRVVRR